HPDAKDPHVVVRYGARGRKATKSGKHRIVPLFGIAARALARWLEILPTYAPKNPFGLVFPLPGGERRDKKSYGWAHLRKAAKIDRHVRWHDLRHTFASSLVAGWWGRPWRLDEVRVLLGHSSVTTTERYAHLAPSVLAQAARETDAAQAGGHAKVTALRLIPSKPAESLGAPQRIRTSDLRLRSTSGDIGNGCQGFASCRNRSSPEGGGSPSVPSVARVSSVFYCPLTAARRRPNCSKSRAREGGRALPDGARGRRPAQGLDRDHL